MKNVLHKKCWLTGAVQILMDPPQTTLIESKNNGKSEKDDVRIKLRMDPTS